jgi:hypothetical protein
MRYFAVGFQRSHPELFAVTVAWSYLRRTLVAFGSWTNATTPFFCELTGTRAGDGRELCLVFAIVTELWHGGFHPTLAQGTPSLFPIALSWTPED